MANRIKLPRQRLPITKKGKKWRKENVDAGDSQSFFRNENTRKSVANKVLNLNLYNGILDASDMEASLNPNNIKGSFITTKVPHHPIIVPKIDLLVGEESNRKFDYNIVVTSPDAISSKQQEKKAFIKQNVKKILESNMKPDEIEAALKELDIKIRSYKDAREIRANRLMSHYYLEQAFDRKFNEGFKSSIITSEEIYQIDIVNNEPVLSILPTTNVHTYATSNSNRIEDSDIIVIEDYWSKGKIIDHFYEELKEKDIDRIESGDVTTDGISDDQKNADSIIVGDSYQGQAIDGYLELTTFNGAKFGNYKDYDGNIRVLRVYWKSQKLIYKVKYYDQYGDVQYRFESEDYILDNNAGEELTKLWVNEFWEGTKIGGDIYLQMRPMPVQYAKLDNPNSQHCGIIGEIYNTAQEKGVSIVDRMKPYQYLYNAVWDRTNKAMAKNLGKLVNLDFAKMPKHWDMDKWLYFATKNGIAVTDSFKEGNKGSATGALAGNFNTTGGSIDLSMGDYIQQHINLLEYIKAEMAEIAGVSAQRQGTVQNRETAQGVERAVNQSSHITEWWFSKHDAVKLRVIQAFMDAAKVAFKGRSLKLQYLLDDQSLALFEMEGDELAEADYGVLATSSRKSMLLRQKMERLAEVALQQNTSLKVLMELFMSDSMADMRAKLELEEFRKSETERKANEQAVKQQEDTIKAENEREQAKLELEKYKIDQDNLTKLAIARIGGGDGDDDGIADDTELMKHKDKLLIEMQKLDNDMKKHKDKMQLENKKVNQSKTNS